MKLKNNDIFRGIWKIKMYNILQNLSVEQNEPKIVPFRQQMIAEKYPLTWDIVRNKWLQKILPRSYWAVEN